MPDIGFGEIIVIVVVALLVFGPDRLPKMAGDAARTLRQVRQMAASARKDLVDAAGLEGDGEMAQTVRDLRDLDPRRAMQDVLTDEPTRGGPASGGPATAERAPGAVRPGSAGSAASAGSAGSASAKGGSGAAAGQAPGPSGAPGPVAGSAGAAPVAPPVVAAAPVDPDWT